MNEKNKSSKIMKKALAVTLAFATLPGANIICSKNIASAWFWKQKQSHTQEEIDSIYEDANNNLNKCMDSAKKLDDIKKAQSFIKNVLDLQDRYIDSSKTYEKAIDLQKVVKELQSEIDVCLNLQEVERRKANEEAEKEALRIEDEHRRKLEEQRLQIEKEERARQEEINNAKASLSEKLFSMTRKARKDIELDKNAEHVNQLSDEIENKILSIDNINRVEAVENLINELQTEIENILNKEAQIRQENFEKTLKEAKINLLDKAEELRALFDNLEEEDTKFEVLVNYEDVIENIQTLEEVASLREKLEEIEQEINYLLDVKAQQEAEQKALEELEAKIEDLHDPQKQLEMLSEGKISLDDVIGGNQKAKAKALALVKAYERYNKGGKIVPSKGLLLYGPPGTGKTSFVNAFSAEQGIELFFINPSLVMGDNGERKVLEIFEQAKKASQISGKPVILLIDEIDAVAQKRSSSSSDKVLVMLMNEIDKLSASDNVIIFATTNRREALDQAIIRSGRLDQSVEVGYPNAEDKEKIMNIYLEYLKVSDDLNKKAIIDKMRGFCGSDIKRVVDIAISSAMERQNVDTFSSVIITNSDLQFGVATVMDEKTAVYV